MGVSRVTKAGGALRYPSYEQLWSFPAHKKLLPRAAMASPPTTSFTAAHTIVTPTQFYGIYGNIGLHYTSIASAANPTKAGDAFPDYNLIRFFNISGTNSTEYNNFWQLSFYHDGQELEVGVKGLAGFAMAKVNGEYVSLTPQTIAATSDIRYWCFDFGSVGRRRIDILVAGTTFNSLFAGPNDSISPAVLSGPKTIVVGDSFAQGSGASYINGYVKQFGDFMGWDNIWASGLGGTGFLNDGTTKSTYRDRIAADVIAYNPDIVVVQGSVNDASYTGAQIRTECDLLFDQIKTHLPECLLVATSPMAYGGVNKVPINSWDQKTQIKASVESFGGVFLDFLELPLYEDYTPNQITLTATSNAGATTISSTADDYPVPTSTYQFPDGSRCRIKSVAGANPLVSTLDGALLTTQTSGTIATQVGDSLWTGTGKVGTVTGYGNSDLYVSSDGVHPSLAGHTAIATQMAHLLIAQIQKSFRS